MSNEQDDQARDPLDARLDELATYETYSAFSQLYCRLVVAWSRAAGRDAGSLGEACERLLDIELWYHRTLADLGERDRVSHDDLRSVADKRRINLTGLAERIEALAAGTPRGRIVRHLLLAECHYHLRETKSVLSDLQAAIASGGGHPLVHFALGYNWFDYAREVLTETAPSGPPEPDQADQEFRSACLSAVQAFRDGLTGQTFDAQLHFWIGRALAAAGLLDEAEAALETAVRIDPEILGHTSTGAEEGEAPATGPSGSKTEPARSARPSVRPISEDEVREFGESLKQSWKLDDLLGDE
jgi:tetratricopeptide (TPR) repeat protein